MATKPILSSVLRMIISFPNFPPFFFLCFVFLDNDTGNVRKWLTLNNNIELEVELSHGKTDINHHKKHGIFRNFSFRKDKQH